MNEKKWIHNQLDKSEFFGNRIDELVKEKNYLEGKVNTIKDETEQKKIYKKLKTINQKLKVSPKTQIDSFVMLDDNVLHLFLMSNEINEIRFKLILFFMRQTISWNTFDCRIFKSKELQEKTNIARSSLHKGMKWLKQRNIISIQETEKKDSYRFNRIYGDTKVVFNPFWDTWIINDVNMDDILAEKNV